jgi:cytochrome c-type protein NapC
MDNNNTDNKPGFFKRIREFLGKPSARHSVITIGIVFFIGGILFLDGFGTLVQRTNTLEFCISCHEMKDTVYQEYKKTIHYSNRTGVRVTCPDCHVPKEWTGKMKRKLEASKDVWGAITGYIHTPELFEQRRMEMATREWARMKASGSSTCKSCHNFEAMSGTIQKPTVFNKHMKAKEAGQTCIDCHQGIAHKLPKEYVDPNE